jgi:cellulose synthase/poly-beta-1,6-N-acetylglucosamine synthase-like glycosyltransferase
MLGLAGELVSRFAASSPWPVLTGWLTLAVALTWSVAGLVLLFFGWLSLPRKPNRESGSEKPRRASTGLRIFGGMILAVGAIVTGTLLLSRGAGWYALAFAGLGGLSVFAFEWLARVGTPGLSKWFGKAGVDFHKWWAGFVRDLHALTRDAAIWVGDLSARLGHAKPVITSYLRSTAIGLAHGQGYAALNLVALLLTIAVGGFAGWMSSSSRWKTSGVITFLGLDFIALGLIGFSIVIVEHAHGLLSTGLGLWLLGIELLGMFLFLAYQFYSLEFLAGQDQAAAPEDESIDPTWVPTVLVQVASYNEPPEIVEACLESTLRIDYPRDKFLVQLVDDSTDPRTIERLRAFCADKSVDFQHRENRRGFKGGALNDGLRAAGPRYEYVAIVDSDYLVEPGFLRAGVQPFHDAKVGFVQTPQAYRNARTGSLARWYALADAYFYRVVQPVRARVQSMIFCGTMGLLRREALEKVGGWSEICVTEDAELSLRLLSAGWKGSYIRTIYGWGLAPWLMSAVRSQHRRWAFGGLQMLRMNREKLQSAHLSLRQRVDFRMGGMFWVDGLFLVGVSSAVASLVVAGWFGYTLPVGSTVALAVIASAPLLLMADGMVKIRLALRATTPVTLRDTLGIMAFWYAIKLNDLRAALRGWWGSRIPFVRTPKDSGPNPTRLEALGAALRDSGLETSIAAVLATILGVTAYRWGLFRGRPIALGSATLLVWLGYYALAFGSALVFDYFSRRSEPEEETHPPTVPATGSPAGPGTTSSSTADSPTARSTGRPMGTRASVPSRVPRPPTT